MATRKILNGNNVPPHGRCIEMLVQAIPEIVERDGDSLGISEVAALVQIQNGLNCSLEEARCLLRMAIREFPRSLKVRQSGVA